MPSLELHRPITLPCGLTLPNRLIKAAIAETWAGTDMLPHQKMLDTYGAWADGDWGLVVTGNVQVDAVHLGTPNDHAINTDIPYEKLIQSWKQWAEVANRSFTPTIIQLNHPGRQSLPGAGTRGLFSKTIAPSVVPVQLGAGYIARFMSALVFGSPREMTVQDIRHVIDCFVAGAKTSHEAGFAGVQIHAAHGYLLAQFLSAKTNHRCDDYGGSPKNRSRIVVEILHEIRQTLPKEFCVGIKLNSVDHQSKDELRDCIQQLEDIIGAGIDLLEISGGTYENPTMVMGQDEDKQKEVSASTIRREAFFLEFAEAIRVKFPKVPLMVTGGFRTRLGMEQALRDGSCDMIGLGRPGILQPDLPKTIIFNESIADEDAKLEAPPYSSSVFSHGVAKALGIKGLPGASESAWYATQLRKIPSRY